MSLQLRIAVIGFGEAAATFAAAGRWAGLARAFDIEPLREDAMRQCGITPCQDAQGALADVNAVLSLVTANAALEAAQQYAPHLPENALWIDMNSVAPNTKRAAAQAVESAGGRYCDVAIMAPVNPAALDAPLLVAGKAHREACDTLGTLGFTNLRAVGTEVGQASAIKMIRSVMVKGIEALTDEMIAAATAAGVVDEVLASLDASDKPMPWVERAAYNLERMAAHGERRAAEMEEVAQTLEALDVEPVMTRGTAKRQREAAQSGKSRKDVA